LKIGLLISKMQMIKKMIKSHLAICFGNWVNDKKKSEPVVNSVKAMSSFSIYSICQIIFIYHVV